MYRQAGSLERVRAPQTRMPRPGKARMTLIPCGFSRSCSLLVTCNSREIAPRTTSFAGALCTPRVSSLRAQMPAMWPLGGTKFAWPARGEDLEPGPVEGGVLRVVARLVDPPLADLLRVQPGRGIEDGDPVAHQLAVGDHCQLYGFDLVGVDHAALVRGHQVGDAEHRDGVDGFETSKSGAVG